MKKVFALLAVAGLATMANASVTFTDATGDATGDFAGQLGGTHMDITSVNVSHDASSLTFVISVANVINGSSNWGKYCIAIDTGAVGGDAGNGWGRSVSWGGQGIDFWVGTWQDNNGGGNPADFGGEVRGMPGSGLLAATYNGNTTIAGVDAEGLTTVTITVDRALLGLTGNDTFRFDVLTTGGGGNNPGIDHLSVSGDAGGRWDGTASTAGSFLSYTIPTPGALALAGMGGLIAARRRRA